MCIRDSTKPVLLSIENLTGKIYVQPNFVYGIYFPGRDSLTNNQEGTESTVDITVYGKDSTEPVSYTHLDVYKRQL